ncbi:protein-(glutamine-N5) methyltransferase, release factor-specific, partial [Candidatus Kuenenbacteria bacterium CG23_combo_of_CG06-09_8_20_14_all_36_9]
MNIKQALVFGTEKLKKIKINSAVLDAEILLSWILKKPKEFIYAHPEKIINSQQ